MTNALPPPLDAPFARDLAVAPDGAAIALPFEANNTMFGVIHGGALASMVPLSTFTLAHDRAPDAAPRTASVHMEYVRAARRPVIATARSVRQVRELEFFDIQITDESAQVIAFASSVITTGDPGAPQPAPTPGAPLAAASAEAVRAIERAIDGSPYLARRQVRLGGAGLGGVELRIAAAPANLDGDGRVHEGAVMTLIDATGATCPYTTGAVSGGATIALHVQILGPLPPDELIARGTQRAHHARLASSDIEVTSAATGALHALGTVIYRVHEG